MQTSNAALASLLIPAALMTAVAVGAVVYWRRRTRVQFRWFWAGAALWVVGVAIKAIWAVFANATVLGGLETTLPRLGYLLVGAGYVGVQSTICEIGLTIAAGLAWRRLTANSDRAVAVGIGAGAFEALLLAVAAAVGVIAVIFGGDAVTEVREQMAKALSVPVVWLIGPVERTIAVLCHTSSRALVLLAVATGRYKPALMGLALFALLDSIAGMVHVAKWELGAHIWLIELAIAPLAVASVPLIRWAIARWPES